MEFGSVFWWNVWSVVQIIVVVGIVVALALFIRWGRRRGASSRSMVIAVCMAAALILGLAGMAVTAGLDRAQDRRPAAGPNATRGTETAQSPAGTADVELDEGDRRYLLSLEGEGAMYYGTDVAAIQDAKAYCAVIGDAFTKSPAAAAATMIEQRTRFYLPAIETYCPDVAPAIEIARGGFLDGTLVVGASPTPLEDGAQSMIAEGTYRTAGAVSNCHIERDDGTGGVIEDRVVESADAGLTVSVHSGESFVSEGCGVWLRR